MRVLLALVLVGLVGCTTVRPGEVGVRRTFGKLAENWRGPGLVVVSPFGARIIRVPVRTKNLEVNLDLPSAEGLNVRAEVSILYSLDKDLVPALLNSVGEDFERSLVLPVFRSAAADISARYFAKDMHSGERSGIEEAIRERMMLRLTERGIDIEAVLLKSIQLPPGLYAAVEEKLSAEQEAQRMSFVIQREEREAERRRIEAAGIRDAQKILEDGLSERIISWRSIEAFLELSRSNNAKIIITDGKTPFLIQGDREDR